MGLDIKSIYQEEIEGLMRERDKYRKALEEIAAIDFGEAKRVGLFFVIQLAEQALKESGDE